MGTGVSKDSKSNELETKKVWKEHEKIFENINTKLDFEEAFILLPEIMHLLRDVPYLDWTSMDTHKLLFFIRTYSGPLPNVKNEQRKKWAEALYAEDMMFLFTKWWKVLFCRGMFNKSKEDRLRNTRMVIGIGWNCVEVSFNCCQALVDNKGFQKLILALNDNSLAPKRLQEDRSNVTRLYTAHACATMILIILKTVIHAKHVFRAANGVDICKKFLKCTLDIVKCKSLLILAYSVNEDEYNILGNQDNAIQYLLKLLNDCLEHADHIGKLYPFLATELIEGINKVAANEDNKRKLVRHGVLEPLGRVIDDPINQEELIAALEVIWTLSFHPENKLKMLNLTQLLDKLHVLRIKSESKEVVRFASGILFTLGQLQPQPLDQSAIDIGGELGDGDTHGFESSIRFAEEESDADVDVEVDEGTPELGLGYFDQPVTTSDAIGRRHSSSSKSIASLPLPLPPHAPGGPAAPPPPPPPPPQSATLPKLKKPKPASSAAIPKPLPETGGHIMISYQWAYKPLAIAVKDKLKEHGCSVWMDVEQMTGSTLESMAFAIEQASTVIICFSESYKNSPSCRTEAEYTYKLRKRFIPIRLESKYDADGWLGIMLGTKLYFDMSSHDKMSLNFEPFLKELVGDAEKNDLALVAASTGASAANSAVANWNQSDVQKWLAELNLPKLGKMLASFDGKTLLALKKMCLKAPAFYYASLKNDFGIKDMVLMLKFTNALESL